MKRPPPKSGILSSAKPCCQVCCGALAVLFLLGLVHALIVRASLSVRCVPNANVERIMPSPPVELSPLWRGLIWMDQGGFYGQSDLSEGSGSLAMSFGGAVVDLSARTARVSNTGPSWSVENNPSGYQKFFSTAVLKYSYLFEFSKDYTFAQIYPSVQPLGGFLGTWYVPKALMSFTMRVQDLTGKACPPPPGAAKWEISECAKWIRESTYFDLVPSWSRRLGVIRYPAFEIVDPSGQRQPAYAAYEQWADRTAEPSGFAARLFLGLDLTSSGCGEPRTSLLR